MTNGHAPLTRNINGHFGPCWRNRGQLDHITFATFKCWSVELQRLHGTYRVLPQYTEFAWTHFYKQKKPYFKIIGKHSFILLTDNDCYARLIVILSILCTELT